MGEEHELVPNQSKRQSKRGSILPLLAFIPETKLVGSFDADKVETPEDNIHHKDLRPWHIRTLAWIRYSLFGVTIKAFVVWLIFYSINATLNGLEASNLLGGEDCNKITVAEVNLTLPETKAVCEKDAKVMKEWIETNKEQFQTFEKNTKTALTFLVGAFVKLMVARWWAQTSKIPKLNRLAIRMNALMREGDKAKGENSLKDTKQEILRLACLSYSIVMLSISNKYADKAKEAIDLLKAKQIITEKEIRQLGFDQLDGERHFFSPTGGAMLKWWRPLNWAMWKIQQETETPEKKKENDGKPVGHLQDSNFKDMSKEIGHIFDSLEHVADYSIRPMPKIAMQAVQVVFWVSLVIATLDNSWKNINNFGNHTHSVFLGILDVLANIDELVVYILLYAWIKMAEIVENPFGADKHFDIDVERQIDTELYVTTAALHLFDVKGTKN